MAWSESKAWLRGKTSGRIYQDLLDDASNAPARNARRKKVVHPEEDRKSTRLNSSHSQQSRMPSSA